ncbi:FAD-binding protein [bacterium]|nr:MAG: FAD-binding protein [bacterium]
METTIIWVTAIVLFAVFSIPFIRMRKKQESEAHLADINALNYGLKEPISLHPVVDINSCIGSGACIEACPEHDVLGLRFGQAFTISPARCIGHGLCERSCPVEAISLVFGSEKRGVDIPRIQENFETNVPGIYIIGELGGMGLIKNAFEQGRQCIEGIITESRKKIADVDVLIVGCGPAGLSAALHAKENGLRYLVIEREDVGGTVRYYPRRKLVMTQPVFVPGYGKFRKREILKEELIEIWESIVEKNQLNIQTGENIVSIKRKTDAVFEVQSDKGTYSAERVILAVGRRGTPRKLDIPGEELSNVSYSLREPDHFQNMSVAVVGGGDSAVEAAMALADQPGNTVRLIYRGTSFSRIKPQNAERLQSYIKKENFNLMLNANVLKNMESHILIQSHDQEPILVENEYVFIFAGGILPIAFLNEIGIKVDTKFGSK